MGNHITVKTAFETTGNYVQYLQRLLRAGRLETIKIGQVWLINLISLEDILRNRIKSNDRRCGPKCGFCLENGSAYTNVDISRLRLDTYQEESYER